MKTYKLSSSLFEEIKQSLQKTESLSTKKDYLKFEAGKTTLVRLVPYFENPKATIFHYYNHGWISNSTGQFVAALCPSTFGEPCPIDKYYLKIYKTGSNAEKEAARPLVRKENWCVNVYVIDDPVAPENNGTVKILRYGKELSKIIESAISGDDADEFGVKIFDVRGGCTLKIKCEPRAMQKGKFANNSQFITYSSSKFLSPSVLDIDDEKLSAIYEQARDLTTLQPVPTYEELEKMLDEHFFDTLGSRDILKSESDDNDEIFPSKQKNTKLISDSLDEPLDVSVVDNKSSREEEVYDDTQDKLRQLLDEL